MTTHPGYVLSEIVCGTFDVTPVELANMATGNPVLVRWVIADDGLRFSWADVLLATATMTRLDPLEATAADEFPPGDRATEGGR